MQHYAKTHHAHSPRFRWHGTQAVASKAAVGFASKGLILALAAVVVLVGSGIIFVLAHSPELTISGSNAVTVGDRVHLHGTGFVPGGTITLTLDNILRIGAVGPNTKEFNSTGIGAPGATDLQIFVAGRQDEQL